LIDLIVFGTEEVMKAFDSGQLKEIFVANKNVNKERILKTDTKTKINLIKSSEFSTKYGELVGIKYFVDYVDNLDNDDVEIIEV